MKLPVLLSLCGSLVAQIPHGDAILSNFNNETPMEGLALVKRNPATITPLTGLGATSRANADVNAIQLDPCDNRVWIGGINASAGRIDTFTVTGTTVTSLTAVGNTNVGASVSGIAFDVNGNIVCTSGTITTTGGLFRVNRKTNAITRLLGGTSWSGQAGTCNCVSSDDAGNLYFAVTSSGTPGTVYQLAPGINGDYSGAPFTVGTVSPPSSSNVVSSLAFAPANGLRPARVWWTTFGSAGTAVGYFTGGVATPAGNLGGDTALNWLDYSPLTDDFWGVTSGNDPDTVFGINHAGASTQITQLPTSGVNGSPSAIDVNDKPFTSLTILPQYLAASVFDFEACTTCPSGNIGGILIVSPAVILLTTGTANASGRVSVKFPNVAVARGTPGAITLQAACFNPTSGQITLGSLVPWPRN